MTAKTSSRSNANSTSRFPALRIDQHIDVVAAEGAKFAAASRRADLDAPVPPCPGWVVRDLVRHLGEIHLWAAGNAGLRPGARLDLENREELAVPWPELAVFWPEDADLVDWYLLTNDNLVNVLRSAPPDVQAPTFLPAPSPLAMWARRQAHETSIHRFDAETSGGATSSFDPELAADGVDELLYGFYRTAARSRKSPIPIDGDELIHVHSIDTEDDWFMQISPSGISAAEATGAADLTIAGTAADLYTTFWNRGTDSGVVATGDRRLLDFWHEHTGVWWDLD